MPDALHTCSFYCERPECVKAQRDELRAAVLKAIRDEAQLREAARQALGGEA